MSEADVAAIRDIEARRCKALVDVDIETLDELFSERLTHVHTTGLVQDKAGFLAGLAAKRPFLSVERGPLTIQVYGEAAVMTGSMLNKGRKTGQVQPVELAAYATQILVREDGRWRYVHFQATTGPRLPAHAPAG